MPIEYSVEKTEARVNEESYSTLKSTLSNGKSTKLKNDFKCQLKSLSNGSLVNCTVAFASTDQLSVANTNLSSLLTGRR